MKNKYVHRFIIGVFVSLYVLVATTSMINSVAFFDLSHNMIMSWTLAIGFELGAAASLAAILILEKTNKAMVWGLFILLTLFQMMANTFHAYVNLENYMPWIELFGLIEEDTITQKRILSVVSGAILPIVALGFIKSLTDYIKPTEDVEEPEDTIKTVYDSYYEERNELFEELTKKNEENYKTEEPIKEITETNNIKDDKQTKQTDEKSNNPQAQYVSKKIKYKP